jgi:hypothetical protein
MRKLLIIAAFSLFTSGSVIAQDSVYYSNGVAVIKEDTVEAPIEDLEPKSNYIRLSLQDVPKNLKRTLNEDILFRGWEKSPLYFDKNLKLYVLHLTTGSSIRSFRFGEDGKPVSYNETTKPDQ